MSSAREHRLDALTDAGDSWRADAARKSPIANHGSRLRVGSFDIYVAHTTHPATLVGAFEKSSADKEVPSMLVSTAKGVASSPAATPGGQRSHPSRGCARGLYATPLRYLCELPLKLIYFSGSCFALFSYSVWSLLLVTYRPSIYLGTYPALALPQFKAPTSFARSKMCAE